MSARLGPWRYVIAFLIGINLGIQSSIRNVGGDAGSLVSPVGGLCVLLFSLAVLFVGPFVTALLQ